METKYLSDGRKVVILGKLNSQEMIVQEIFVTKSGDEIPSGESFTAKSLHDEPVLSYREKENQRAEERLKGIRIEIERAKREEGKIHEKLKGLREIFRQVKSLADNFDETKLETLVQFMTGTIEYLVIDQYSCISEPVKMADEIQYNDGYGQRRNFDGIKLCSLIGKSDGDLEFRINRYSDGSGSSREVYPFTTYGDAIKHIQKLAESMIGEDRLSREEYDKCIKMGIQFSSEHYEKFKTKTNKSAKESIERQRVEIKKAKGNIEKLEDSLM